jgi:NAD(P)-dependent dehydrogenase (short-subunit alcohol dehydrogenase family)
MERLNGISLRRDLPAEPALDAVRVRRQCCRKARPPRYTRRPYGGGSIVNVASVNGAIPGFHQGIYPITKATVISSHATGTVVNVDGGCLPA